MKNTFIVLPSGILDLRLVLEWMNEKKNPFSSFDKCDSFIRCH